MQKNRQAPTCVWVRRKDVDDDFANRVESLVLQIYPGKPGKECPFDYILLAYAENVPTRMLRKFIVASPAVRQRVLGGLIATEDTTAGESEELAARMLRAKTALVFFDTWPKSGIPETFVYPRSFFETTRFQRGYTANQFYIGMIGNYGLGGYFQLPIVTANQKWESHHDIEFMESLCAIADPVRDIGPNTTPGVRVPTLGAALDRIVEDIKAVIETSQTVLGNGWLEPPMLEEEGTDASERELGGEGSEDQRTASTSKFTRTTSAEWQTIFEELKPFSDWMRR